VSSQKYWTVEEAREAIPRLREMLSVLRRAANLATTVRSNGHAPIGREDVPDIGGAGEIDFSESDVSSDDIQPVLEELERGGIVLRDPARGLIDFPAMHLGRMVHLCWQLGEEDLDWWHFPDDGFAGRKRLPLPSEW
jgi:hypothetical protein